SRRTTRVRPRSGCSRFTPASIPRRMRTRRRPTTRPRRGRRSTSSTSRCSATPRPALVSSMTARIRASRRSSNRVEVVSRVTDDIEAIKQLKARYFRTMDTKDWAGMRAVFTDDVVVDTSASDGGVVEGADAFMAFLQGVLADVITVHHGHMPEIELTSPTTATGVWAMEDVLRWPNGLELRGYGHYHETYVKLGAAWRIKSTTLTRLRRDIINPG